MFLHPNAWISSSVEDSSRKSPFYNFKTPRKYLNDGWQFKLLQYLFRVLNKLFMKKQVPHFYMHSFLPYSSRDFSGSTVGLAFMSSMCSPYHSVGVIQVCLKIKYWFYPSPELSYTVYGVRAVLMLLLGKYSDWKANIDFTLHFGINLMYS